MDTITKTEEIEPASGSLDDILADFKPLEKENSRMHVFLERSEACVKILLTYEVSSLKKRPVVAHLGFRINSKGEVFDNQLIQKEHPECYEQIRNYLISKGYDVPEAVYIKPEPEVHEPEEKSWFSTLMSYVL